MFEVLLAFFHKSTPKAHKKPLKLTDTAGGNLLEKENGYIATMSWVYCKSETFCCKLHARFHCKLSSDMLALFTVCRSERESTAFTSSNHLHH